MDGSTLHLRTKSLLTRCERRMGVMCGRDALQSVHHVPSGEHEFQPSLLGGPGAWARLVSLYDHRWRCLTVERCLAWSVGVCLSCRLLAPRGRSWKSGLCRSRSNPISTRCGCGSSRSFGYPMTLALLADTTLATPLFDSLSALSTNLWPPMTSFAESATTHSNHWFGVGRLRRCPIVNDRALILF